MKIIELKSTNIKNLKAVEIRPDGKSVVLTGKNGAGKSAVLDSIFTALTGKKLTDPIRHGQERPDVNVDMGDFRVRKVWSEKGDRLEVTTKDGDTKKSPQTFLNEIIGNLSFDPLEFSTMKPKEQRDLLAGIVGLDMTDLNNEEQAVRDERKSVNDKIRDAVAQLREMTAPGDDIPNEEKTFKEKLDAVNRLREQQRFYAEAVTRHEEALE